MKNIAVGEPNLWRWVVNERGNSLCGLQLDSCEYAATSSTTGRNLSIVNAGHQRGQGGNTRRRAAGAMDASIAIVDSVAPRWRRIQSLKASGIRNCRLEPSLRIVLDAVDSASAICRLKCKGKLFRVLFY